MTSWASSRSESSNPFADCGRSSCHSASMPLSSNARSSLGLKRNSSASPRTSYCEIGITSPGYVRDTIEPSARRKRDTPTLRSVPPVAVAPVIPTSRSSTLRILHRCMPGCARSKVGELGAEQAAPARAKLAERHRVGVREADHLLDRQLLRPHGHREVGREGVDVGQQAVGGEQVADAGIAVVVADDLDAALGLGVVGALGQERELDREVEVAARQDARLDGELVPQPGRELAHVEERRGSPPRRPAARRRPRRAARRRRRGPRACATCASAMSIAIRAASTARASRSASCCSERVGASRSRQLGPVPPWSGRPRPAARAARA